MFDRDFQVFSSWTEGKRPGIGDHTPQEGGGRRAWEPATLDRREAKPVRARRVWTTLGADPLSHAALTTVL